MTCNGPAFVKVPDTGADPDLVDGIVAGNPALIGTPFADVTHAGWLPAAFFNALAPNGGTSIIAATFTFIFVDDDGNPTDVDRNGRADVAFREIYYNRAFAWGTGGNPINVDIQTAAIHEFGHGLGLAHFGKLFFKNNGTLQFAPIARMNGGYTGEDRELYGPDNAAFCHIWATGTEHDHRVRVPCSDLRTRKLEVPVGLEEYDGRSIPFVHRSCNRNAALPPDLTARPSSALATGRRCSAPCSTARAIASTSSIRKPAGFST